MSTRTLSFYGPRQFPDALGFTIWEFERAVRDGLIPPAGPNGRWPAEVVDDAIARCAEFRALVGDVPDCGAVRASEVLAQRLGSSAEPDAVAELARQGRIKIVGEYKENPIYDGRQIAAFDDRDAYITAAI